MCKSVYENGKAVYRPTVHYAYMPCGDDIVSLHELRCAHPYLRRLLSRPSDWTPLRRHEP